MFKKFLFSFFNLSLFAAFLSFPVSAENNIDQEKMLKDIRFLASPEMRGRGFGSPELDKAAAFIAGRFKELGLKSVGDTSDSYFQTWSARGENPEREVKLKNVIGVLPGTEEKWKQESVVVGAHYDHLGLGYPDVRKGDEGKIHPGADDNASGIAVLFELARFMKETSFKPKRTIVFIAFSGEEEDRLGSKYLVSHPGGLANQRPIAMINMDTVGRLGTNPITLFGTGSAKEWEGILREISTKTNVDVMINQKNYGASDEKSFLDAGIPSLQVFSGPNTDYHRPSDTIDKIDGDGLVKVARFVTTLTKRLASEPVTLSVADTKESGSKGPKLISSEKKVSLGTIPDMNFQGKGVFIYGIVPDSPAEKAGLLKGDVITAINERSVEDLMGYTVILRSLSPGDMIAIRFNRNGEEHVVKATVIER